MSNNEITASQLHHSRAFLMNRFILAAAVLVLAGTALHAQPRRDGRVWRALDLTEAQQSAITDIRRQAQKGMIDLRAEMQKKRIDLRAVASTESPDRTNYERLSRDMAELRLRQKLLLFDTDQSIREQLDPEQQKKWKELRDTRLQERGERVRSGMDRSRDNDAVRGFRGGRVGR
jgi:Spy/CpxP family protein refolding chaperone